MTYPSAIAGYEMITTSITTPAAILSSVTAPTAITTTTIFKKNNEDTRSKLFPDAAQVK